MTSATGAARLWAAIAASLAFFLVVTITLAYSGSAAVPTAATSDGSGAPAASADTSFDISLKEFEIDPAEITAPAGAALTFNISNAGQAPHDYTIDAGPQSEEVPAGGSTTLEVPSLEAGEYRVFCSLPGHAEAGMEGTLTVTDGGGAAAPAEQASDHGDDHVSMTPEQMVAGHVDGIKAFPAKTEGMGNQPLEPTMDGDVKVFELTADEISWEVSPGEFKDGMAYNGQIPGPRLEANVGDKVRVILHNELDVPTAIHPHGLVVPVEMDGVPGLTQDPVMPGDSFTYEYTLRNSGSHMYHSHFDSAVQVPGGLLGAFIVHDDKEPKVDLDYTMILNDGPLGYTINGKGFPATEPLAVKKGQKIRVRYMNEGLQIHPMHLHGIPQQVIAKDGYPLPQPHLEDTVLIAPGERVDVIIEASEPGPWAFHCHILNHAEAAEGMFGMVTALIVE